MRRPPDWRSAAILAAFALLLGGVAAQYPNPGVHARPGWYPDRVLIGVDFYPPYIAAHALRAGLPLYEDLRGRGGPFTDPIGAHEGLGSRYTYPPPVAYLYLPLSWFPVPAAWRIHTALAIAGLTLTLWLLTRLAGGGAGFCLLLAALTAVFYPVYLALVNGNVALWCYVLLVIGMWSWTCRGSDTRGALGLALSIVVKVYPVVFLVYFALRKRWRLLCYTGAALLIMVALTAQGGAYPLFFERAREFDRFVQAWHLNASFFGILMMRGVSHGTAYLAARIFSGVVVGLALLAVRRPSAERFGELLDGGLLGAAMLLVPNTNYDYNLIFLLPGVAALLAVARDDAARVRGPLVLGAISFLALAVPTEWMARMVSGWGLHGHDAEPAASKFGWLLLFFAALLWRRLAGPARTVASPT
jgi:hypothetical protein